ncbi:hypothetical protein ACROYT_G026567 [Oculina patagonica]
MRIKEIIFLVILLTVVKAMADTNKENKDLADVCFANPVGISDQAKIPDQHMTASFHHNDGYQPAYGRLNGDGWCAKEPARNDDWLQVDLGTTFQVCAVASQGESNFDDFVTDFKLSYSLDGNVWTPYKDANGVEVEFHRQGGSNTVEKHRLSVPMSARYVRFHPTKQHNWNCLRVELYSASGTSLKMDSKILSVNMTYESELQKLLPPAVRDKQNWKLCYRHSTDDINLSDGSSVFHSKCDEKNNTVIIVKVGDYVFGGYTDIAWELADSWEWNWRTTPNAFIFSLRNKEGVRPFKSVIKDPEHAIASTKDAGPFFGLGYNLALLNSEIQSYTGVSSISQLSDGSYYDIPDNVKSAIGSDKMYLAGTYLFDPDEVEAFYLA